MRHNLEYCDQENTTVNIKTHKKCHIKADIEINLKFQLLGCKRVLMDIKRKGWGCLSFILLCCCFIGSTAIVLWIRLPNPPELPPEVATTEVPSISPSSKYELQVIQVESAEGFEMYKFQVKI